ncbi:MAG: Trk system potassium transporter TrkA [Prevotellaceae bacterium]|jgi:trk system potassium uptake protein TrkA|nr:Trk system potassium transporter TrkA [Prevotellaceae bacterium]
MKIVIAGAGEVGFYLAKLFTNAYHDVTIIDSNEERLRKVESVVDALTINGLPTLISVLNDANIKRADLFIAVNPAEDQDMNITCALLAKALGAKRVIARINNNEYLFPYNKEIFLNLGIDYLIYPERIASNEIIKMLRQTGTSEYIDFSGGKLQLIVAKLEEGAPLIDKTADFLKSEDNSNIQSKIIAITRNSNTSIVNETDEFQINDTLYVIADKDYTDDFLQLCGKTNINVRNLMILGGSRIGTRVARELEDRTNIKIIENELGKCEILAETLPKSLIISGDGRNMDLLIEEEVKNMDAFVAVTGSSEINILACMSAKRLGVKKTIAEVENIDYIKFAEDVGIDTVINKKIITASKIFRFTIGSDVQTVKYLSGSDAKVLEFIVKPGSMSTKKKIGELNFQDAVIAGIIRGDTSIIANDDVEIKPYDRVILFTFSSEISQLSKFFG